MCAATAATTPAAPERWDGDGDDLEPMIVELSSPPVPDEEPSPHHHKQTARKRVPRAFHLDTPQILAFGDDDDKDRETKAGQRRVVVMRTAAELRAEFAAVSEDCAARGPMRLLRLRLRGYGCAALLSFVVALAAAVVSVVSYNLACADASRASRVVGTAVHNFLFSVSTIFIILNLLFLQYPSATRNRGVLAIIACLVSIYPAFFTAEWAMFPTKEEYFEGIRKGIQIPFSILADGIGTPLLFWGIFEVARWHWIRSKSPGSKAFGSVRTQSGAMHALAIVLQILVVAGILTSGFGLLSFTLARALVIVGLIPALCILTWSLTSKDVVTWSGGFAVLFSTALASAVNLSNLLPIIMALGGEDTGVFLTLVKFFAYYTLYGGLFSAAQLVVSRMTDQNTSPQFMFMFQVFVDAFVGLAFVELRTPPQFWTLLILQSLWGLFRNTGLFAFVFLHSKRVALRAFGRTPADTDAFLLKRDQYFFYLNTQSILSDIQSVIAIPLVMVIDHNLPFGTCSVSCTLSHQDVIDYVRRYGIIFAFRVGAACIVCAAYTVRYAALVSGGWKNLSLHGVASSAKSLLVAFHLHLWRNIVIFIAVPIYLYMYVLYTIVNMHGFGDISASFSSSSSSH